MRFDCWIIEATDISLECEMLLGNQSYAQKIINIYIYIYIYISHYGPGVDSASNRNEYQEYFLGVKAAGA